MSSILCATVRSVNILLVLHAMIPETTFVIEHVLKMLINFNISTDNAKKTIIEKQRTWGIPL